MSILFSDVIRRYISTSPKRKLRNNTDVTDYFAGDNDIISRSKSAAVKDIDIDIGHGDIDPPLIITACKYEVSK